MQETKIIYNKYYEIVLNVIFIFYNIIVWSFDRSSVIETQELLLVISMAIYKYYIFNLGRTC